MIVFPMAGLSSRFTKAGYDKPKYMLEAGGRSLFRHAVEGFEEYFGNLPFLFIYRDIDGTDMFLRAEVARIGIKEPIFVQLDRPTRGQAETVAIGLQRANVGHATPVTIFNIDTIRSGFRFPNDPAINNSSGWLEVFQGSGDNWSFVGAEEQGSNKVARVTEKDPISDLCCTGLYHFSCASDFLDAFNAELANGPSQAAEFYVAPLFNRLITAGADIRYDLISANKVVFSGIPAEYEALVSDYG